MNFCNIFKFSLRNHHWGGKLFKELLLFIISWENVKNIGLYKKYITSLNSIVLQQNETAKVFDSKHVLFENKQKEIKWISFL